MRTLHAFPGRLLLFFQPHGYGPLRTMKDELIATFAREMAAEDVLIMPDPVYYGGTTEPRGRQRRHRRRRRRVTAAQAEHIPRPRRLRATASPPSPGPATASS